MARSEKMETWGTHKAAAHLGITDSTLKNWDVRGLLEACGVHVLRTPTGYRKFIPAEIENLADLMRRQEVRVVDGKLQKRSEQQTSQNEVG
jgi:DNA-binding transcriptional MerR regulator